MITASRWSLAAAFLFALAAPAWACLWYYGTNVKGERVTVGGHDGRPKDLIARLATHEEHDRRADSDTSKEPAENADFRVRSDFAATLVHQGKVARAVEILESVEKAHPGEYIVGVNLGTAYELSGDNEKALRWIREGLKRNAQSHYGTEWLHVKILEAKIAAAKDPEWIKTHSVLGLDFGSGEVPVLPEPWPLTVDVSSTIESLYYQLEERLAFVPPPDPLVAGMIADMGTLMGLTKTADHAVAAYDLALTYKPVNAELIARRRAHAVQFAGQIVSKSTTRQNPGLVLTLWIVAGGAVLVCIALVLKKKTTPA